MAATTRQQVGLPPTGVSFPDSGSNGFFNTAKHSLFGNLYLYAIGSSGATSPIYMGGMMAFTPTETNSTRLQFQAGNDWGEFVIGTRQFGLTFRRFIPRGYDLRSIVHRAYGYVGDVDFRQLPLVFQYLYSQSDPSGQVVIENSSYAWMQLIITELTGPSYSDTHQLLEESGTAIGRGLQFQDSDGNGYSNAPALWGSAPST
jgi:hypothetical protein